MTFIARETNEYGTPISRYTCDYCGTEYTLTVTQEVLDREDVQPQHACLGDECPSYDIDRDVIYLSAIGVPVQDFGA